MMRRALTLGLAAVFLSSQLPGVKLPDAWAAKKLRPVAIQDTRSERSGATGLESPARDGRQWMMRNVAAAATNRAAAATNNDDDDSDIDEDNEDKSGKDSDSNLRPIFKTSAVDPLTDATAEASAAFKDVNDILQKEKVDVDDELRNEIKAMIVTAVGPRAGMTAEEQLASSKRLATMNKLLDGLKGNSLDSNKKFEKFYTELNKSGFFLQDGKSQNGRGVQNRIIPLRKFDSPDGRLLQLGKHISSNLFYHADDARAKAGGTDSNKISEVQTMFIGDDIYIATNSPEGTELIGNLVKDQKGGGLLQLIGELPASVKALKSKADLGDKENYDKLTRLQRFRKKITQLANGTRNGEKAKFARAASAMENIKKLAVNNVNYVDVDFDGWDKRDNDSRPKVIGADVPKAGTPRLFLVRNVATEKYAFPVHAETGLAQVLAHIRSRQTKADIDATRATISGKKRACGSCAGELIQSAARGHNVAFSLHSGKLWNNQTSAHNQRANLITAYMTLTNPPSETYHEPDKKEVGAREHPGIGEFDEDSESSDNVEDSTSVATSSSSTSTAAQDDNDADDSDKKRKRISRSPARKRASGR